METVLIVTNLRYVQTSCKYFPATTISAIRAFASFSVIDSTSATHVVTVSITKKRDLESRILSATRSFEVC